MYAFMSMGAGVMVLLTVLSLVMAREYFSEKIYKSARKKIVGINVVIIALFIAAMLNAAIKAQLGILIQIAVMWFMLQAILAVVGILVKIFRLLYEQTAGCKVDDSRRRFLRGVIWVPAVSAVLYGGLYERRHIEFDEVDIDVSASGASRLNGMKIVQLSDVHLGNFFSLNRLQEVMVAIVQKAPDMLVITGDIFDDNSMNDDAIKLIDKFTGYFPFGVYFCWGNHEHLRGIKHLQEVLSKTNIKLLNNSAVKVLSGDKPLYVLGVDYLDGEHDANIAKQRDAYVKKALSSVPENAYKILLAHHSIFIDEGFANNINLTLCGHTHGGQFAVMGIPLIPIFKYMAGKFQQGNCIAYVSRGAGSWMPYRMGCPPEITTFNFVNKG